MTGAYGTDSIGFTLAYTGAYALYGNATRPDAVTEPRRYVTDDAIINDYNGNFAYVNGTTGILFLGNDSYIGASTVTISLTNENYQMATTSFSWTVGKKTVSHYAWTLSGAEEGVFTVSYDGALHTVSAVAAKRDYGTVAANDGYAIGSTVVIPTSAMSDYTGTDVRSTPDAAIAAGATVGTYYVTAADSQVWSITAREITINWGTKTREYNGLISYTGFAAGNGNILAGDTAYVTIGANYNDKTVATGKTITATLSGSKSGNYTITNPSVNDGVITVKNLTVTRYKGDGTEYAAQSFTYNAANVLGVRLKVAGVIAGDSVTVVVTGGDDIVISGSETEDYLTYTAINAGNYSYSVAAGVAGGTDGANYNVPTAVSAAFAIDPKSIALTWSATNVTGGTTPNFTKVYDGATSTMSADGAKDLAVGSASAGAYCRRYLRRHGGKQQRKLRCHQRYGASRGQRKDPYDCARYLEQDLRRQYELYRLYRDAEYKRRL